MEYRSKYKGTEVDALLERVEGMVDELSPTNSSPVPNYVVANAIEETKGEFNEALGELREEIGEIANSGEVADKVAALEEFVGINISKYGFKDTPIYDEDGRLYWETDYIPRGTHGIMAVSETLPETTQASYTYLMYMEIDGDVMYQETIQVEFVEGASYKKVFSESWGPSNAKYCKFRTTSMSVKNNIVFNPYPSNQMFDVMTSQDVFLVATKVFNQSYGSASGIDVIGEI